MSLDSSGQSNLDLIRDFPEKNKAAMLFYIGLNFLATLKIIELQLDVFKTRLEALQVEKYFETEGMSCFHHQLGLRFIQEKGIG